MDASRVMVQTISWSVFIVAVLSVIATWYLLIGLVTLAITVGAYWVRKKRAKEARPKLAPASHGVLGPSQIETLSKPGVLSLEPGKSLRVVNTLTHSSNFEWLAKKYQVERSETLNVVGAIVAGVEWLESEEGSTEEEVLYVASHNRVVGQLADVDLIDWYDNILEVGGSARCRLSIGFNDRAQVSSIEVLGWSPDK